MLVLCRVRPTFDELSRTLSSMLEGERAQRAAAVRRASHPQGSKSRPGSATQQQSGEKPSNRAAGAPSPAEPGAQQDPEQQAAQPQRQPTPPDSLSFDGGGTSGLPQSLESSAATDSGGVSSGGGEGAGGSAAAVDRTAAELIDDEKLRRASNAARRMSESSAPQRPFHMQQAEQQTGRPMPRYLHSGPLKQPGPCCRCSQAASCQTLG